MRNKKASMELSVNSIVILVIAVVMMGLILAFIKTKATDLFGSVDQYTKNLPEPVAASSSTPISMSPENIVASAGSKIGLKVAVFNVNQLPLKNLSLSLFCTGAGAPTLTPTYFTYPMLTADSRTFSATLKIGSAAKDTYLCQLCVLKGKLTGVSPNQFYAAPNVGSKCNSIVAASGDTVENSKEFQLTIQ